MWCGALPAFSCVCFCLVLLAWLVLLLCFVYVLIYKDNLDIRVKCPTYLLSLGLATGAASSACRFLQEDRAPLTAWLLTTSFLAMIHTHKHTNWHKLRNLRILLFFFKSPQCYFLFICPGVIFFLDVVSCSFSFVANHFYLCYLKCGFSQCGKSLFFLKWYWFYMRQRKSGVFMLLFFCIRCLNFYTGERWHFWCKCKINFF